MKTLLFLLALMMPVGPFAGTVTGRPKTAPCVSGACSDTWTGPANQLATAHNTAWVDLFPSGVPCSNIRLTGSGTAGILSPTSSFNNGGCLYNASSADTSQIVMLPMQGGTTKYVCARALTNVTQGYCGTPAYAGGGSWTKISIQKNGAEIAQAGTGAPWSIAVNHTVKIVTSGTSTVTVSVYMDGVLAGSTTDSSSPLPSGHPGFYVVGTGSYSDLLYGTWQDH
jgi:hypothetical protein